LNGPELWTKLVEAIQVSSMNAMAASVRSQSFRTPGAIDLLIDAASRPGR
jgi:hypothetical protein